MMIFFSLVLSALLQIAWGDSMPVEAPCGILENFLGDVQILDPARSHSTDAVSRAALPCGAWISVTHGWAQIRHQNGPHVYLASQTFAQLIDFKKLGDHVILYRGQIYLQAGGGEEFRILTASGRARVHRGEALLIFDHQENETQLISLDHVATLENRFEPSRSVKVQAGESTTLNFKLLRVIPSLPQAISAASLRPRLDAFHLLESDAFNALRAVLKRQNRSFASDLSGSTRKSTTDENRNTYLRHIPESSDVALHDHWVKKMVGGETIEEGILFPNETYGKHQKAHLEVVDPGEKFNKKLKIQEEIEKKRLINELSQIRME